MADPLPADSERLHAGTEPPHTDAEPMHADTALLHADAELRIDSALVPPIHYSATFVAEDAAEFAEMAGTSRHSRYYTRYGNPLHERVARVVARLEGTETALVTASGMGAITTTALALLSAGDHVIAQSRHYMSTTKLYDELLPRFGVAATFVEQADPAALAAALRPTTRLIMVETPANPTLVLTDLDAVAALARPRGIVTVADNTFASPLNQQPHRHGIDVVIHSATKYLGGHHDLTAGVVCTSAVLAERIWATHITMGAVLSPMDAWLLLRGLRTLAVRIERINRNALAVAQFLESHPAIERIWYPGLASHPQHPLARRQMRGYGAVIAFAVRGGFEATSRFVGRLKLPAHAVSLGGVDSLAVHTAAMWAGTMNEAQMHAAGIAPNLVRFSVGIEHVDDLTADLARALG
ncbi:MAG: PLP-dependent aspartate aminotransferase family protein [Lautropia sp.]